MHNNNALSFVSQMLSTLWSFVCLRLGSSVTAEWAAVAAELLVALVIYWEFAGQRRENFVEQFNKNYWKRRDIYNKFAQANQLTLVDRRTEFRDLLFVDPDLRGQCDEQIDHLNALWRSHKRFAKSDLLEWFPHTVAKMWVMLGPYVLLKIAQNGRAWGDQHFIDFARAAMMLLCRQKEIALEIRSGLGVANVITITKHDLSSILKCELKN